MTQNLIVNCPDCLSIEMMLVYGISEIMLDLHDRACVNMPRKQEKVRNRKDNYRHIDEYTPVHRLRRDRGGQWEECKDVYHADEDDRDQVER